MIEENFSCSLAQLPYSRRPSSRRRSLHSIPRQPSMSRNEILYEVKPFTIDNLNDVQLEAVLKFKLMNEEERRRFKTGEESVDLNSINTAELVMKHRMQYEKDTAKMRNKNVWRSKAPSFVRRSKQNDLIRKRTSTASSETVNSNYDYARILHRKRRESNK